MPISTCAQLRLCTRDPREAVGKTIELVATHATTLNGLEIDLGLTCMARGDVALRLAERLPSKALGFHNLGSESDRALSAEQFQTQGARGMCSFNGVLTEHLLPGDALALIRQLLECPPQAIRSTALHLNVKNIHWKDSPPGSIGTVHLFDFKAFRRAERFSLSATLQLPGDDPKSSGLRDTLRVVAEATHIPFSIKTASRVLGHEARSPDHAQAVLIGQICFEEAMESLADQLPQRWVSEFAPSALPPGDAFEQRCQTWGGGSSSKVNLPPIVKRAVKQRLPEFKFNGTNPDQILFTKRIGPDAEMLLLFEKAMPRIGKAFTMSLGVRDVAEQRPFKEGVFHLERTTEQRTWIYADMQEAEAAVNEAVNLGKELLPRFESSLKRYFEPWPKDFPAGIDQHGRLTAREAFAKAEPLARRLFPDAALIRLFNHARSLVVRDIEGPELSLDGRLIPNALWWFHFYSEERDASFQVTVPAVGRIRILDHGKQYQSVNARRMLVALDRDWMDSDRAFALAEERGGRERRSSGRTFGLFAKLQMSHSGRRYWAFMYAVVDERGRNDLIVNLDAGTGEPLDNISGF